MTSRRKSIGASRSRPERSNSLQSFDMQEVTFGLACVVRLQLDRTFASEKDRVEQFVAETGKSRPTCSVENLPLSE